MLLTKTFHRLLDLLTVRFLLAYQRYSNKPLIVRAEKYGRLGNRLYLTAHLIAWARQTGAHVVNLGFDDYEDLFESTYLDTLCRYPEPQHPFHLSRGFKNLLRHSLERISIRLLDQPTPHFQTLDLQPEGLDIGDPSFKTLLISKPVTFIRGFIFNNSLTDIVEERPAIQRYFITRKQFSYCIEQPIADLRKGSDIVLGILIRHGDYKTLWGGEYYFETTDYVRLMDDVAAYLAPKKVGFFIASDQEQPTSLFEAHLHFFRPGHPIENLGALSLCDGLLTAPSSFTGWAGYYGNVPTFHISQDMDSTELRQMLDAAACKASEFY